jgi:hypothetical protein
MKYSEQLIFILTSTIFFYSAKDYVYNSAANFKSGIIGCLLVYFAEAALQDKLPYKKLGGFVRIGVRIIMLYLLSIVFLAF